ncbi:MAG: Gfo/Idh/MocA family oxidoreductase [Paracoccaceae bacterium]|nr:Gfo/Idh/MocA family oxidoreductase [Paracoccaceae bacterium]
MRIAVIGAGLAGRQHIEVIKRNKTCKLDFIVDPSDESIEFCRKNDFSHFPNIAKALATREPDGAIIATPNSLHLEHALDFIDREIPILVEKPLSSNFESALSIVQYAKKKNVDLLTGHHRRHNKIITKAKNTIDSGQLGRLVSSHSMCWLFKPDDYFNSWRNSVSGGPVLINLTHDIDLMRYLIGEIESVHSFESNTNRKGEVEDSAVVNLRYENGTIGTLSISDTIVAPWSWENTSGENPVYPNQKESCYWIGGTHGSLELPQLKSWESLNERSWWKPIYSNQSPTDKSINQPLSAQLDNFISVVQGKEEPVCSGKDGLKTLLVVEAIKLSARIGKAVEPKKIQS